MYLTSFFKALTEENPYHPINVAYNKSLPAFFNAIQKAMIENVLPSEASHIKAFKQWIAGANLKPELKALPEQSTVPVKIESIYEMAKDHELQHTHDSMLMLIKTKNSLSQCKSFYAQKRALINEMHKRNMPYSPKLTE